MIFLSRVDQEKNHEQIRVVSRLPRYITFHFISDSEGHFVSESYLNRMKDINLMYLQIYYKS